MPWDRALNALQAALVDLYPDEADARRVAEGAGLNTAYADFGGSAMDRWHSVLSEAVRQGRVEDLIALAQGEYRVHAGLAAAVEAYHTRPTGAAVVTPVAARIGRGPLLAALGGLIVVGIIVAVVASGVLGRRPNNEPTRQAARSSGLSTATVTATATPEVTRQPTATATQSRPTPFPTVVYTAFQVFEPPDSYALQTEYRTKPGILPSETITDFLRLTTVEWGDLSEGGESSPAFRFGLTLRNTSDLPIGLELDERYYSLADTRGGAAELAYFCCADYGGILPPGQQREIILIYRMVPGWFGSKGGPGTAIFTVQGLLPVLSAAWELPLPKTAD